ncbi:DUF512 domain-containing protein [bacterium]|nr:DUF512 domain-containing protein [bacterium]MBU1880898.1 DUF512 domain-containing protein [bacterium]
MVNSIKDEAETGVSLIEVQADSAAEEAGLRVGDRIVEIDGMPMRDYVDFAYAGVAEVMEVSFIRKGKECAVTVVCEADESPGWKIDFGEVMICHCNCIFCFVDQLPPGLRDPLQIKDEDYRQSFFFGTFLTLAGLKGEEYRRIAEQKLSPLYISIHATDAKIRGRLLGIGNAPILPHLKRLIDSGIELHGQIVVVPGYNDGEALEQSLTDLAELYPGLKTLGVVPVGLTKHRDGLPPLRLLTKSETLHTLKSVEKWQQKMLDKHGTRWVFPADEFLRQLELPIPDDDYYEEYWQYGNGVGMMRFLIEEMRETLEAAPDALDKDRKALWVTGAAAFPVLSDLAVELTARYTQLQVDVIEVENQLMGDTVSVANLLGGEDIYEALRLYLEENDADGIDVIYLPPICVNPDKLFLDDWSLRKLRRKVKIPIRVYNSDWNKMIFGKRLRR